MDTDFLWISTGRAVPITLCVNVSNSYTANIICPFKLES